MTKSISSLLLEKHVLVNFKPKSPSRCKYQWIVKYYYIQQSLL